jgi:hypothetical protein
MPKLIDNDLEMIARECATVYSNALPPFIPPVSRVEEFNDLAGDAERRVLDRVLEILKQNLAHATAKHDALQAKRIAKFRPTVPPAKDV